MYHSAESPSATGILTSRIGRRFVALFLGCAFLPLVVFAWMTLSRVTTQMDADLRESLHNGAKTSGMGIAARLSQVAADLARLADTVRQTGDPESMRKVAHDAVAERCSNVWILAGDRVTALRGDGPAPRPDLGGSDRTHLAAGKALLRVLGESAHLVMMVAIDRAAPDAGLLVADLHREGFWDPQELRSPGAEFVICDEDGVPLRHSFRTLPSLAPLLAEKRGAPSAGTFEWIADGEPHVARYWRAFLRPQYDLDLLIVQSRSRVAAYEVADAFSQWFLLTALGTLLCVLLASLVQMRRTLGPIVVLGEATRLVAQGDLSVRVAIRSRDEFGTLGKAFNHMTAQIAENVRRREQTERELVASRDQALEAAHAKAEFVTNVSHEFRTPMTEILGAIEILSQVDDSDAATRREFTAIAVRGARRLARLIDDVLELGSPTPWQCEPVHVGETIEEAVSRMPDTIRERVRVDVAKDLPPVLGDPARLGEVWCRLIDNAAKFSAEDSPIEVHARWSGEVVVEVVDQGVGVSRLDLDRIFQPFMQVGRDQMTDKAQGTGLGLTLAKSTIEKHGGRIEVDSELGNGATFRVHLPATADEPLAV